MTDFTLRKDAPAPPTKLSDALELALNDIDKVRAMPNRALDMTWWLSTHNGVCYVCMAGAVMDRTLLTDADAVKSRSHLDFGSAWQDAFNAIDSMRAGCFEEAAESLGAQIPLLLADQLQDYVDEHYIDGEGYAPWPIYRECVRRLREAGL